MNNFKYILEKGSKKHICVSCGKKSAVRYIDAETGDYLAPEYSRCDREMKCGYWGKPEGGKLVTVDFKTEPPKPITTLPIQYVNESLKNYDQNSFATYLSSTFEKNQADQIIKDYRLGTAKSGNAVIFWQIDQNENIRYGKIMQYDEVTGRRKKEDGATKSVFKELKKKGKIKDYNIEQCFFGLHLINDYPDKIIAIVESEKTACLMSILYPNYLWMACTALSHLQEFKFAPIKNRKIILYPDLGLDRNGTSPFEKWSAKAKEYNSKGYDIEVSTVLENIATKEGIAEGYDIADYFLENLINKEFNDYAHAREEKNISNANSVKKGLQTYARVSEGENKSYGIIKAIDDKDFSLVNMHTNKDFFTVTACAEEKSSDKVIANSEDILAIISHMGGIDFEPVKKKQSKNEIIIDLDIKELPNGVTRYTPLIKMVRE